MPAEAPADPADRPAPRPTVLAALLALTAVCSLLPWVLTARGMDWRLYPWGSNPSVDDDDRRRRFDGEARTLSAFAEACPDDVRARITLCSDLLDRPFAGRFPRAGVAEGVSLALAACAAAGEAASSRP